MAAHSGVARADETVRPTPSRVSPGFALPGEFWSQFHAEHWEKRPTVLKQPFTARIVEPHDGFRCLVDISDRYRAGDRDILLKFCVGQTQQLADVGRYLPERGDGSMAAYAERVTRMLGGQRFGLVVEDFQAFDATLWLRLREFLGGLFELTGLPRESAKATVFLGNYERTPWGLHRGRSGNFQLIVDGPKRIRAWPDAFFQGKEDPSHRLDYRDYNAGSTVLDAAPGDVIYWPSDTWHIGESVDGALSFAISVALFIDQHSTPALIEQARGLIAQRLEPTDRADRLDLRPSRIGESAAAVDAVVQRATAALREVTEDASLELGLRVAWLNHVTAFGFTVPPKPLPHQPLADESQVRAHPAYPIVWLRTSDDELICSANGHAFSVTASPRILALMERLNGGAPHRVRELVDLHAGTAVADGVEYETTADDIRALLEKLASLRAITVES